LLHLLSVHNTKHVFFKIVGAFQDTFILLALFCVYFSSLFSATPITSYKSLTCYFIWWEAAHFSPYFDAVKRLHLEHIQTLCLEVPQSIEAPFALRPSFFYRLFCLC
jgi:hypothetical protein